MKKIAISWSGGKDSCLASFKAITSGLEPVCLLNTISKEHNRVRFHGTRAEIIEMQAKALGIKLVQKKTSWPGDYTADYLKALAEVKEMGAEAVVFGDLFPFMTEWAKKVCRESGLECIEPLCAVDSEAVVLDIINSGFEAVVVSTQADKLGEEWLGRRVDKQFLDDIKNEKDVDVCGENGEYHTLVVNGPTFKQKLELARTRKHLREGYWYLDIEDCRLADA